MDDILTAQPPDPQERTTYDPEHPRIIGDLIEVAPSIWITTLKAVYTSDRGGRGPLTTVIVVDETTRIGVQHSEVNALEVVTAWTAGWKILTARWLKDPSSIEHEAARREAAGEPDAP